MKIVESKKADVVTQAIIELLYPIRTLVHTITSDNGKEFSYHEEVADKLNIKFYFCDPYSSWQRGLNEHMPERSDKCPWGTNGLVREYIPKKSSFEDIHQTEITIIQNRLNNRPRKIIKYYTPNEIFFKEVSRKMVA